LFPGGRLEHIGLLFDPFIKGNPIAENVNVDSINANFVLITHAHGDHIGDALGNWIEK
jgi:L-ascorbate metabolism protein UlaG (beta-lactamase superfamily)